ADQAAAAGAPFAGAARNVGGARLTERPVTECTRCASRAVGRARAAHGPFGARVLDTDPELADEPLAAATAAGASFLPRRAHHANLAPGLATKPGGARPIAAARAALGTDAALGAHAHHARAALAGSLVAFAAELSERARSIRHLGVAHLSIEVPPIDPGVGAVARREYPRDGHQRDSNRS